MERYIVEAVADEKYLGANPAWGLRVYVSVSRATTGESVTGLTKGNFRIAFSQGMETPFLSSCSETSWEPSETLPSGCYVVGITRNTSNPAQAWDKNEFYSFGIQVRTFDAKPPERHEPNPPLPTMTGCGQTVFTVREFAKAP